MWARGHNGDIRRAAHGNEATRDAAMAASLRAGDANTPRLDIESQDFRADGSIVLNSRISCIHSSGIG
jgi:hypothetical protein